MATRELFGSYVLLKKVSEDPLGETFRAGKVGKQGLERVVLLRVFNGPGIEGEQLWQKVSGRAALQQALKNPNIGDGVDMGQVRGTPYVAYDYISGKNLGVLLDQSSKKGSPVPLDHALLITERIALALAVACETRFGDERVLHGFLVPHLVMLSNEGETRLLGFEVSPALRPYASTTGGREQFARFLAPEALAGGAVHKADDVYSLGGILFELLTGEPLPLPTAAGYGPIIDQAMLANEGTAIPADISNLLKRSLVPRDQRVPDVVTWHKGLSRLMMDGHYNPTTFNLAFFMHNLFRDEIERETQEMAAEKRMPLPTAAAPAATAPPPAAPRFGLKEETSVREEPAMSAAVAKSGPNKTVMIAAAVGAVVLGGIIFLMMNRGGSSPAPAPEPTPAATPAAPAGPSAEQLQAQIDKMIQERLQANESNLKKKYDDQLATLQKQLDDARRAPAPVARPVIPSPPPSPKPSVAVPAPSPVAPSPAPVSSPPATPTPVPSPAASIPAPTPAAPPPVQEVHVGDLVLPGPGVIPPRRVNDIQTRFPEMARRANRMQATVVVRLLVDENGQVSQVELRDRKVGFGFDEAAVDAARRLSFSPATKNGVRVKMWVDLAISFSRGG
ncbi:MAG: TonB family protein [Acidobacteriota bacterium]